MKRILLGLILAAALSCGDDNSSAPTSEVPVSDITLTQFGTDSLRVTFSVNQTYNVAVLRTRTATLDTYSSIDSIPGTSIREFRTRWTDWIRPPDSYGWVGVELGWGASNTERYARFEQFIPAP